MIPDGNAVKLALLTRRYPPLIGGAEKVLSYLAPALAAGGAEVTVLTARPADLTAAEPTPQSLAIPPEQQNATPQGRLTVIRLASSRLRYWGTWLYMRRLRCWLERHPIDLAYVSMLKHDAYVALGVGKRRGFPVVLRPEGAGATGDLAWQSWGRFGQRIGRRCRTAGAIVSISPAITAELTAAGYDPATIVPLPNGVPIPHAPWQRRPGWSDAPRALFIGRLAPEKGLDLLIDAWPMVRGRHPKAQLTLIGAGPERPALAARIAARGLAGAVELPGATDDPTPWLRTADLFVLPSREEGMSIALLEAMALGIPLVASAIPGNRRLITDETHGRLAAPGDPTALAHAILDQWADFERAVAMGEAARRQAAADYSIEAVARKHLELFQAVIENQSRSRNPVKSSS
jgi:glycosyltransferase involved in cell wall biosynthesis